MPDQILKTMSHGNKTFYKDSKVYGEDERAKSML